MGSRAQRQYGCRVGMRSRAHCTNPKKDKVTLICQFGHVITIWLCVNHIEMVKRRYLVCKTCVKMGRVDIKCREMPLVADLPSSFRSLTVQFDSE